MRISDWSSDVCSSDLAQLQKDSRALDSQTKLARLLSVEAAQTAEQISTLRRNQFQARLGERRDSLLGTPFWSELRGDLPRALRRLARLAGELRPPAGSEPHGRADWRERTGTHGEVSAGAE